MYLHFLGVSEVLCLCKDIIINDVSDGDGDNNNHSSNNKYTTLSNGKKM